MGQIVAIKGLGGFHLACRADSEAAVAELRGRKHRDAKPFAVMCATIEVAKGLAELSDAAVRELSSAAGPIVLAGRAPVGDGAVSPIAASVAAGSDRLGVMIPYTPLHHLLFTELGKRGVNVLVMTSANRSDEPLVKGNEEAMERLTGIADAIVLHERDIERSIDDSVLIDMGPGEHLLPIRRARGYVPQVIRVNRKSVREDAAMGLCLGGELKSTVAVVRGDEVILSHHLGDLKHTLAYEYFQAAANDLCRLFEVRPQWIAHDLHPAYLSTQWAKALARKWEVPLIPVQHHHAHAAAVLAEHGVSEQALAIVCDGVGYGPDGSAWGGELLLLEGGSCERLGHLRPFALPGGDAAARDTRRCAVGVLHELGRGSEGLFAGDEGAFVAAMLQSGRNSIRSSAAGRLFDAVAGLLGVCLENSHEAQAGMALEALARSAGGARQSQKANVVDEGAAIVIDLLPFVAELGERKQRGAAVADLAADFHEQFCQGFVAATVAASRRTGIKVVGLSGGVFCNEIVTKRMTLLLSEAGLRVLRHQLVPPNDGGIAFGQAAVAMLAGKELS